jgi:transcription antitermination factor NusA-like protein
MEKGWKEAFLTAHEYKASMARDILENAGIKTVIMDQHDTAYQSFGNIVVYVPEADLDKALGLLKELKH